MARDPDNKLTKKNKPLRAVYMDLPVVSVVRHIEVSLVHDKKYPCHLHLHSNCQEEKEVVATRHF